MNTPKEMAIFANGRPLCKQTLAHRQSRSASLASASVVCYRRSPADLLLGLLRGEGALRRTVHWVDLEQPPRSSVPVARLSVARTNCDETRPQQSRVSAPLGEDRRPVMGPSRGSRALDRA